MHVEVQEGSALEVESPGPLLVEAVERAQTREQAFDTRQILRAGVAHQPTILPRPSQ